MTFEQEGPGGGGRSAPAGASVPLPLLLLVTLLAGGGTLVMELSAVRVLAPWFGASSGVWTNVIGVVLLALAMGYALGARLATTRRARGALITVLVLGGLLSAMTPYFAHRVCGLYLPADLNLEDAASLFGWGSLAATLLLFGPAALALGCVGPLAVELTQRRGGGHAGTAGGLVLCASTLGSLGGTFLTTHVLLPEFGVKRTLLGVGCVLLICAALLTKWGPAGRAVLVLFATGTFGLLRVEFPLRPPAAEGVELLAERESAYQWVRVVERDGLDGGRMRQLQVNEGLDSFQSVWQEAPGLLGEGFYYDLFALPAFWSRAEGSTASTWRTWVVGLGAGTVVRVLEGAHPEGLEPWVGGAEIDPVVVELGQEFCGLAKGDAARGRVASGIDGRLSLRCLATDDPLDLVVLDAYAAQIDIPLHLSSLEFFLEVHRVLRRGGWIAVNVSCFGFDDPVLEALGSTLATALGQRVLALRVPKGRNVVLMGRRDAEPPEPRGVGWAFEGEVADALLPPLSIPSASRWFHPGEGRVLTDDLNPMELLQRRSLALGRSLRVEHP